VKIFVPVNMLTYRLSGKVCYSASNAKCRNPTLYRTRIIKRCNSDWNLASLVTSRCHSYSASPQSCAI